MPSECSVNKSPVAGLPPRMGSFDCCVAFSEVCVRAGCLIDTLESDAQLRLSLRQRDRNEPNPREGGGRDKKPDTHWSHRPLVLISNFCGIVSLILPNCCEPALLLSLLTMGKLRQKSLRKGSASSQ